VSVPVIVRPEAEADLAEGFDWYEERREGSGYEFLREVRSILAQIEENPLRNAVLYQNVRRALVRRFPYKVFYFFEAERVEIIGVIHAKRAPEFWQKRL
jgi:plasmid stabilization system protein ParE